jgi:hypothetical protein
MNGADVFGLKLSFIKTSKNKNTKRGRLSFQISNRPGVKKNILGALVDFKFDHDGDPRTPLIPLYDEAIDESPLEEARASKKKRVEIFNDAEKIYSLLLVVEGGPITLKVVQEAIDSRTPVVVIEGSGRVADILSYAWRLVHDDS